MDGLSHQWAIVSTSMPYFYLCIKSLPMNRIHTLLIAGICFFSQSLFSQGTSDWTGSFEGSILGASATLIGLVQGDQWSGTISVSGYPIKIEGTIIDMKCTGNMTDPQTKSASPFTAVYAGKQITISIRDINPITGLEENMEFVFLKTNSQQVVGSIISSSVNVVENTEAAKLDNALIGLWRYTDTYVSGEYSFATDYFLQFKANGVIITTDGRTAGGGPTSSLDSGDGDTHQGVWKSENKTIWTKDNAGQWQSYARYYVDGNSMMLTYNNGRKQVWEKL